MADRLHLSNTEVLSRRDTVRLLAIGLVAASVASGAFGEPVVHRGRAGGGRGWCGSGASGTGAEDVTVPAGTTLPVVLETTVGSDISRAEQPVRAHLARRVLVDGVRRLPDGSAV